MLDDAVDDDDEGTRGAADLHLRAAEYRDEQTGDDGRYKTLGGAYTRGDTESDGKRNGHDADDDTGHGVAHKEVAVVAFECAEELGSKINGVT